MSINNSVLFVGEQSLGTVAGAPLAADANNQLVSGLTTLTVASTSNTTTTSGTASLLTGMTITPGVAGTFWTMFTMGVQSTTGGNSVTVGIYANGVLQGETQTIQFPTATLIDSGYPFSINVHFPTVTVTSTQAITIQWSTNGGTATALNRRLSLLRII